LVGKHFKLIVSLFYKIIVEVWLYIVEGIVIHGSFDPNYIIFRNVEYLKNYVFFRNKNLKESKNLLEYLKMNHFSKIKISKSI
jgi:hypothetical protein